jgi:hypothetical protein
MRALRILVLVLAWLPLCGAIVSQEGDQIEILLNEEYTGDQSKRSGYAMGGVTVPSGDSRILLAFMSMIDTNAGDAVPTSINWDNAGTPQALTLRTLRTKTLSSGWNVMQQVGYLLAPAAVTGQFAAQFTGNIHAFGLSLMVFDHVDQDEPFDFTDYFYVWPQNTAFKWNYSLAATHDACAIDFLSKWKTVPSGSMQHDLGTPGGTLQVLRDNQEIGDAGSSSNGWRSISTLHSPSGVSECRYRPAGVFGMYRENTNFSLGGVYEIFQLRQASKCIFGSAFCTP